MRFHLIDYQGISYEAAWFLGTGFAIILLTNVVFLLGFAAASYMMLQPTVFVGAVLFPLTTAYSFAANPQSR